MVIGGYCYSNSLIKKTGCRTPLIIIGYRVPLNNRGCVVSQPVIGHARPNVVSHPVTAHAQLNVVSHPVTAHAQLNYWSPIQLLPVLDLINDIYRKSDCY